MLPRVLRNRILSFAVSTSLATSTLLTFPLLTPVARAHVGHGDEFQQQGDARQVKRQADSDGLLGVVTVKPEQGPDGLTVPATALVNADGKPLLFIQTETTYDPVFVETGASQGDRVLVTEGIDSTDDVVSSGALSLYAESKKSQQAEPAVAKAKPGAPAASNAAGASNLPLPALAAAAVVVLAAGGIWLSRRQKTNG